MSFSNWLDRTIKQKSSSINQNHRLKHSEVNAAKHTNTNYLFKAYHSAACPNGARPKACIVSLRLTATGPGLSGLPVE